MVMEGVADPEMLEAMACREGLAVAADLLNHMRLASSCSSVFFLRVCERVLSFYRRQNIYIQAEPAAKAVDENQRKNKREKI
jgi:hypothetical protein